MGAKLEKLRSAKVAHPKHKFTPKEEELIESLSASELKTLIALREKLGAKLLKKRAQENDTHPNTLLL